MSLLRGKAVLVSGGTVGAGFATARLLLAGGARIAITGGDAGSLKAAQRQLGRDVVPLRVGPADGAGHPDIARTLAVAFGRLDAIVLPADTAVTAAGLLVRTLAPVLTDPASIVIVSEGETDMIAALLDTVRGCFVRVEAANPGPITSVPFAADADAPVARELFVSRS